MNVPVKRRGRVLEFVGRLRFLRMLTVLGLLAAAGPAMFPASAGAWSPLHAVDSLLTDISPQTLRARGLMASR